MVIASDMPELVHIFELAGWKALGEADADYSIDV
jgi:hypothetical protein